MTNRFSNFLGKLFWHGTPGEVPFHGVAQAVVVLLRVEVEVLVQLARRLAANIP